MFTLTTRIVSDRQATACIRIKSKLPIPTAWNGRSAGTIVCAEYEGAYRSNDNFLGSDCLSVECDNDHSDNPADWKTTDDIADAFPGVEFAVHYKAVTT